MGILQGIRIKSTAKQPRNPRDTPVDEYTVHSMHLTAIRWARALVILSAVQVGLLIALIGVVVKLFRAISALGGVGG